MISKFKRDGINFVVGGPTGPGIKIAPGDVYIYAHATYRARNGKLHVIEDGAICADTEAERERNITLIVSAFRRAQDLCDASP
jgi:hypothetical protein